MCHRPPEGWICFLPDDHTGSCPTYSLAEAREMVIRAGNKWRGVWEMGEDNIMRRVAFKSEESNGTASAVD